MKLSIEQKEKLLRFIGYGNLNAPLWFLGMEEGIGGQAGLAEVEKNIRIRAERFSQVEDLAAAHDHFDYDVRVQPKFTSVWVWMAKFTRAILHQAGDWRDVTLAKDYVRNKLGRSNSETLLTEIMPLPALGLSHWFYEDWASREAYMQLVLPQRQQQIRELIKAYQPRYVLAYGSRYHPYYHSLMTSAPTAIPHAQNILIGKSHQTTMILMPFFGQGALSTADAQKLIDYLATL